MKKKKFSEKIKSPDSGCSAVFCDDTGNSGRRNL